MLMRVLVTGILAAGFALAQPGGGGMGGMGEGGGRGGRTGGEGLDIPNIQRTVSRIDLIGQELRLDKDQKKAVKNILDDAQKEANPVRDQIVKSRLAIGEAIQNGKAPEDITQLVNSQAALEAQMAEIELGAFAKIYKSLQPDQRNLTRNLFASMKGIFDNKNWNNVQ